MPRDSAGCTPSRRKTRGGVGSGASVGLSAQARCRPASRAAVLAAASASGAATVRNYDLGDTTIPDPDPKGPLPVRLWGVIGVPDGPGPHPLVVIAHGRHGDNCPRRAGPDTAVRMALLRPRAAQRPRAAPHRRSPGRTRCRRDRARSERRLHVRLGTGGRRTPLAANHQPDAARAGDRRRRRRQPLRHPAGGPDRPDADRPARALAQRPPRRPLGALPRRQHLRLRVGSGQVPIDALLLLAPVYRGAGLRGKVPLPDLPTAIVLSQCDGDVPRQGRRYFTQAHNAEDRDRAGVPRSPRGGEPQLLQPHPFGDRTRRRRALGAARLLEARAAAAGGPAKLDRQGLLELFRRDPPRRTRPAWMRLQGPEPTRLYGLPVAFDRLAALQPEPDLDLQPEQLDEVVEGGRGDDDDRQQDRKASDEQRQRARPPSPGL